MGSPAKLDAAPAKLDVGVMVLGFREPADTIHEGERVGEVREPELALQRAVDLAPALGRRHADQYDAR